MCLLERFRGRGNFATQGFRTCLVAAKVEGEFGLEGVAVFGGFEEGGGDVLEGGVLEERLEGKVNAEHTKWGMDHNE